MTLLTAAAFKAGPNLVNDAYIATSNFSIGEGMGVVGKVRLLLSSSSFNTEVLGLWSQKVIHAGWVQAESSEVLSKLNCQELLRVNVPEVQYVEY